VARGAGALGAAVLVQPEVAAAVDDLGGGAAGVHRTEPRRAAQTCVRL